jgi:hypothetical protein
MSLQRDEQDIRQLVSTRMAATKEGEVDKGCRSCPMTCLFLMPGQPHMRKAGLWQRQHARKPVKLPSLMA